MTPRGSMTLTLVTTTRVEQNEKRQDMYIHEEGLNVPNFNEM